MFDGKAFGEELAAAVRAYLARQTAPILDRLAALERRLDALPAPREGTDADPAAIAAQLRGELAPQIAALSERVDGIVIPDIPDLPDIPALIAAAVAALPAPKDGESVTVDDVAPLLADLVERAVAAAVAALPPPRDGEDGASVTLDDVRQLVVEAARAELATWDRPKDGDPGKDGKMPIARAWADAVHYEGAVVTHEGATWQAMRDTGRAPPHEDWICLAARGEDGAAARSPRVRGTWSPEEAYQALDIVALGGSAFMARRDAPGPCPGEDWQVISARGKSGKPGERGLPGDKGNPGPPGPAVVALTVDDDGLLTLTHGDGSTVECDLYPLLSRLV